MVGVVAHVVLCEPWFGGSHRSWAKGLQEHSSHRVTVLALPDEAWRWRLRGSAPWFAEMISSQPSPDLLLVSGLVDAAVLRGLIGRKTPMVLYMHESQGAYPSDGERQWDTESVVRNWQSMLAADQVWFNSRFHLDTAMAQIDRLMGEMPGEQHLDFPEDLIDKCHVVYPGVELEWAHGLQTEVRPVPTILWPHRWEADKQPEVFERALLRLESAGLDFGLILAGAEGNGGSEVRERLIDRFNDRIIAAGPFDLDSYRAHLTSSDIVVSCTAHEFFGIAVVEALAAGCVPVLPNGFSYPELVDSSVLYEPGSFGTALEAAVRSSQRQPVDMSRFDWPNRISGYDHRISGIV